MGSSNVSRSGHLVRGAMTTTICLALCQSLGQSVPSTQTSGVTTAPTNPIACSVDRMSTTDEPRIVVTSDNYVDVFRQCEDEYAYDQIRKIRGDAYKEISESLHQKMKTNDWKLRKELKARLSAAVSKYDQPIEQLLRSDNRELRFESLALSAEMAFVTHEFRRVHAISETALKEMPIESRVLCKILLYAREAAIPLADPEAMDAASKVLIDNVDYKLARQYDGYSTDIGRMRWACRLFYCAQFEDDIIVKSADEQTIRGKSARMRHDDLIATANELGNYVAKRRR